MRKVKKDLNNIPVQLQNCTTHLDRIINERKSLGSKTIKAQFIIYSGPVTDINSVKYKLKEIYKNKCAFCESSYDEMTIDHYRPKDSIANASALGYFWLCYEWSNLIFACGPCNEIYKRYKFPILGSYIDHSLKSSLELKQDSNRLLVELNKIEKPLILNPEEKNFSPQKYIKFDRDGKPSGIDKKGRGQTTIDECGLDKTILNGNRKSKLDNLIKYSILQLIYNPDKYTDDEMIIEFKQMLDNLKCSASDEYTLFYKWSIKNIKEFVYDHPIINSLPETGKFKINLRKAIEEKLSIII